MPSAVIFFLIRETSWSRMQQYFTLLIRIHNSTDLMILDENMGVVPNFIISRSIKLCLAHKSYNRSSTTRDHSEFEYRSSSTCWVAPRRSHLHHFDFLHPVCFAWSFSRPSGPGAYLRADEIITIYYAATQRATQIRMSRVSRFYFLRYCETLNRITIPKLWKTFIQKLGNKLIFEKKRLLTWQN